MKLFGGIMPKRMERTVYAAVDMSYYIAKAT